MLKISPDVGCYQSPKLAGVGVGFCLNPALRRLILFTFKDHEVDGFELKQNQPFFDKMHLLGLISVISMVLYEDVSPHHYLSLIY